MRHTVQDTLVTPGSELGPSIKYLSGVGTYEEEGKIFASRKGALLIDQASDGRLGTISIQRESEKKRHSLAIGDTVYGVVSVIDPR